jgi:hypothetical protein
VFALIEINLVKGTAQHFCNRAIPISSFDFDAEGFVTGNIIKDGARCDHCVAGFSATSHRVD